MARCLMHAALDASPVCLGQGSEHCVKMALDGLGCTRLCTPMPLQDLKLECLCE